MHFDLTGPVLHRRVAAGSSGTLELFSVSAHPALHQPSFVLRSDGSCIYEPLGVDAPLAAILTTLARLLYLPVVEAFSE